MHTKLTLMPQAVLRRREFAARRRVLVGVPLIALAIVALLYVLLVQQVAQARRTAKDVEKQLAPLRPVAAHLTQLQTEIEEFGRRQQDIQGLLQHRRWSALLEDISRLIPRDVWLQSLALQVGTVTVSGSTRDLRSAAQFARSLERSAAVAQVQIQALREVRSGAEDITEFQLVVRLKESVP